MYINSNSSSSKSKSASWRMEESNRYIAFNFEHSENDILGSTIIEANSQSTIHMNRNAKNVSF